MVLNNVLSVARPKNKIYAGAFLSAVLSLSTISANAQNILLGDSASGKTIHDSKCDACHTAQFQPGSKIYTRPDRRVKTVEGLMKQVAFCNAQTGANLSDNQVNDVIKYLNETFYKFE